MLNFLSLSLSNIISLDIISSKVFLGMLNTYIECPYARLFNMELLYSIWDVFLLAEWVKNVFVVG